MKVRFDPEASAEVSDAVTYYEAQRRGLGKEFLAAVREATERIRKSPDAWSPLPDEPGVRRCRTHRFPYGLIYRVRGDAIEIVACAHLRRKPGYWANRL